MADDAWVMPGTGKSSGQLEHEPLGAREQLEAREDQIDRQAALTETLAHAAPPPPEQTRS